MTPSPPAGDGASRLGDEAHAALHDLVASYLARHPRWHDVAGPVRLIDAEVLSAARPGIIDVVAEVAGAGVVHVPLGLRVPGDEARLLADGEDPVLGVFDDGGGAAVAFDAMRDGEAAALLLRVVANEEVDPALVRMVRSDEESITVAFEDRLGFTVFNDVVEGPRPALEMLVALDEEGFNHLAAPLALWRRGGRDLGIVQEYLAGGSTGWALALTSVRDLYGSGGPPELAGGDFGAEAHRLGTMTARMHIALDRAFGRRPGDVGRWADDLEAAVAGLYGALLERPDVVELLDALRRLDMPCHAIRTHGDLHLGRVWRTEQGWYVIDFEPGGRPTTVAGTVDADPVPDDDAGGAAPIRRSPLADVADMLWSFEHVSTVAADERDPTGREGLSELADAWEQRNRRAFLAGYLGVPGIAGLVPANREAVRVLEACFELPHVAARLAYRAG